MLAKQSTRLAIHQRCEWNKGFTFSVANLMAFMKPQSAAGQKYTPPNIAGSSISSPTRGSEATGAIPTLNGQHNAAQAPKQVAGSRVHTSTGQSALSSDPRILFGVKGSDAAFKLEQIEIRNTTNDGDFYGQLRKHYRLNRGRFRYWFSFWRLGYCEVVKARHNPSRGWQ